MEQSLLCANTAPKPVNLGAWGAEPHIVPSAGLPGGEGRTAHAHVVRRAPSPQPPWALWLAQQSPLLAEVGSATRTSWDLNSHPPHSPRSGAGAGPSLRL